MCIVLSTVDLVKEIAKDWGWNGEKPVEVKILVDLKISLQNGIHPNKDIVTINDFYILFVLMDWMKKRQ